MKDLNKVEQIGYYTALQMLQAAEKEVVVADCVTVAIGLSADHPEYKIETNLCYVIRIKGNLIYAIEPSLDRLIYFINRANSISIY